MSIDSSIYEAQPKTEQQTSNLTLVDSNQVRILNGCTS